MDESALRVALRDLGRLLFERGLTYDLVVVGGGALMLRGLIARGSTKDVDVLGQLVDRRVVRMKPIPDALAAAVADVADLHGLAPDWLNTGPDALLDVGLPHGFEERLVAERMATLTVWYAARVDMIAFKLFAAVDQWPDMRSRHMSDLRELAPSATELALGARWTLTHDDSPTFRENLALTLGALGVADVDTRW